jgi:hypothetical protein
LGASDNLFQSATAQKSVTKKQACPPHTQRHIFQGGRHNQNGIIVSNASSKRVIENGCVKTDVASAGSPHPCAPALAVGRVSPAVISADTQDTGIDLQFMLKIIFRETKLYLENLNRAAAEGRAVDEANNFLRWLQFSGVVRLLEKYSFVQEDFKTLRAMCESVQDTCKPHLQGRKIPVSPSQSRADEANDKLDILLAVFAKNASSHFPPSKQEPAASVECLSLGSAPRYSGRGTLALQGAGETQ